MFLATIFITFEFLQLFLIGIPEEQCLQEKYIWIEKQKPEAAAPVEIITEETLFTVREHCCQHQQMVLDAQGSHIDNMYILV
jgi:hypothetical protein